MKSHFELNMKKHTAELLAQYFERSQKEAQAEANLLQALRDVAQLLAWQNNGECRGSRCRLMGVCLHDA